MKTIIQGNKDVLKEFKYFQCIVCGWVGKAEKSEYECTGDNNFKVECPCCSRDTYNVLDKEILETIKKQEQKNDEYENNWYVGY